MKKTKKITILFSTFIFMFLLGFNFYKVNADFESGSLGDSGPGGSNVGGQKCGVPCAWSDNVRMYMFDLVKKKSDSDTYTRVASYIVGNVSNIGGKIESGNIKFSGSGTSSSPRYYNSNTNLRKIKIASNVGGEVNGYADINGLKDLARYLNKHNSIGATTNVFTDYQVGKMLQDFGVARCNDQTKECVLNQEGQRKFNIKQSDNIYGDYGYRILIQKFGMYTTSCCNSEANKNLRYLLNKESSDARNWSGNSGTVGFQELFMPNTSLGIAEFAPGITDKKAEIFKKVEKTNGFALKYASGFANKMNGAGYNIIWMKLDNFLERYECTDKKQDGTPKVYGKCDIIKIAGDNKTIYAQDISCNKAHEKMGRTSYNNKDLAVACPYKPKYNYDIDAVCENCDSTNEKGSYQIQDTIDWEAILHSLKRTDKPTSLMNYYKKTGDILCREEYNVVLPNANTVKDISIEAGRYLLVNKKGETYINGVYNFEPIKVTKTRQCISTKSDASAARQSLDNYSKNHKINSDFGSVNLNYIETKYGHQFIGNESLKQDDTREKTYASSYSDVSITSEHVRSGTYQIRTDKADTYFKLKDDTYRYVATGNFGGYENGESVLSTPPNAERFQDLGTANLPISIKNTDGATIGLNYQLPSASKLGKLLKNKGKLNQLEQSPTEDGIYQKWNNIRNSACGQMYGVNNAQYSACASRSENAINRCLKQFGSYKSDVFTYTCEIKTYNCNKDNYQSLGRDWNPYENAGEGACCPEGTKYNADSKTCEKTCYPIASVKDQPKKYVCKDGSICDEQTYTGENYNASKSCNARKCITYNGNYYGQNGENLGTDVTEFNRQCSNSECALNCEAGYCCEDTTMLCPAKDENGMWTCPAKGKEIIYRTIDLNHPFPGQAAAGRNTGANWCSKNMTTGKIVCSNNNGNNRNPLNFYVQRDIKENRKEETEAVYTKEPMYVFELTSNDIKAIQNANKNKVYNDSTWIKYNVSGKVFYSEFFRNGGPISISDGTCKTLNSLSRNRNGLIQCAEG